MSRLAPAGVPGNYRACNCQGDESNDPDPRTQQGPIDAMNGKVNTDESPDCSHTEQ